MTGIEIVGLLLGAVPLAISALEHYKEGIDVISDFRNYRSTLKSLKAKLSIQEELYRGTLQRLLLSELSQLEVHALFPEPGAAEGSSASWGTKEIEDKLHRKLGIKFDLFMNVVVEMNTIMEKLIEKLDVDMNGKPKWKPRCTAEARFQDRFTWEWRRIRRSLGRAEREELISSFERYNTDLASFVQNHEILSPHSDGQGKGFMKYLDLVRNQACGLHTILENSWNCTCNAPHKAYLRLQHPFGEIPSLPIFGVTFPSHKISTIGSEVNEQKPAFWNHTSISISKLDNKPEVSATEISSSFPLFTQMPQNSQTTVKFNSSLKVGSREKKTSKVQFSSATKMDISSPTVVSLNSIAVSPPLQNNIGSTATSLCKILCTETLAKKSLGYFPNATKDQVASITTDTYQEFSKPLCLKILLSTSVNPPQIHQKLSDKDRLKIALTLASTVLQLYDSPWIDSVWSGQDVQFIFSQNTDSYETPLLGPFVSTSFYGPASESEPQQLASTSSSLVDSLIPSKVLFALAVMLVELCLDKTLVEMQQLSPGEKTGAQKMTLLNDYETICEQLNAVYQKSGSNYGYVVERCLKCEFNIAPNQRRLGLEEFRRRFYEGVVAPLEENYKKYLLYRGDI